MYISINTEILRNFDDVTLGEDGTPEVVDDVVTDARSVAEDLEDEINNLLIRIKALEQCASELHYAVSSYVTARQYLNEHIEERYAQERLQECYLNLRASIHNHNIRR